MFNFNIFDNPEPYNIYLCKPNKKVICELNGIDDSTASITINLNNQYELSFDYFRYIYDDDKQKLIESNGYDKLCVGMNILVENIGYFKMNYPPFIFDGDTEKKTITASSIECELENKDITLKVNTGEEDSLEYLVVYDENETESLLNDYTGLPYDYIVFYNTYPEQLNELLNKYSDGTYTSTSIIEEIKNYCDLIPRLKSKINTDSNGDTTVEEYVAFTYDESGENISKVKLTNFNSRIQTLITFYTKYRNQLSLVSLIMDKCSPNWKLGEIDPSLYNKKFQFDISDKNIYSFLTQDLSSTCNCIFKFNLFNSTIDMISVDNIGKESNVIIDRQTLLNNLEVSCDENSIYTRYSVSGGDGLGIEYVNFGEPYIDDISYFLNAKDKNGERIYVSDSLAEKYKLYQEDRDIARKTYSDLTAQYNHYTDEIFELKYRVPNDIVSTDWGTYKMEELEAAVTTYNNLLCTLQTCYKEDYGTAGCNADGSINENYIKNTEYWYDYYAYKQALDQISEAIDCLANDTNYRYIDDEQILAKINAWKTEWTLYGTVELQNKIIVYENNMKVLVDGEAVVLKTNSEEAKTWSELTNTEKQEYNNLEVNYQYEVYNKQYTERNSCREYLDTLLVKLNSLETSQNSVQSQRVKITNLVSLTGYNRIELNKMVILNAVLDSNSFTEQEIADINLLYIDKKYSNENIITTSIDSIETKIEVQYELLEDAREKLSIDSQPQISFTANIDNLLAIPEFKDFDFDIGNYVVVQYYDDYYVKLRLESLQFNPRVPNDELTVTFTNYIKSRSKRTDVSYILGQVTSSGGSSGSSSGSGGSGIGIDEISNTLLSKLLNTEMFGSKVSNLILDTLKLNELNTKYLKVDGLANGTTIIDGKCIQTGYIRDKYYNGSNGNISNTKGSIINLETGNFNLAGGSIIFDGTNVTFGENVTLSWNQITDKEGVGGGLTEEEVTQITKNTISTAIIKASQIKGETLTLGGSDNTNGILLIKNANGDTIVQGDKDGLLVKNGNIVADAIKSGTLDATKITVQGLVVGENVTMGDTATISWNQVSGTDNVATKSYVTNAITESGGMTEEQVTEITKNTVTTSYVNALKVTAKEVSTDWVYAGAINADQITSGTLDANKVTVDGLVVGKNVTMSPDATISWNNIFDNKNNLVKNASDYVAGGKTGWVSDNTSHFTVSVQDGYTRITRKSTSNTYYVRIPLNKEITKDNQYHDFIMKVRRSKSAALTIYFINSNNQVQEAFPYTADNFTNNTWVKLTHIDTDYGIGFQKPLGGGGYTHLAIKSSDFTTNGETIDFEYIGLYEETMSEEKVTEITKNTISSEHIEASDFTFVDSIKMIDSAKKMTASPLFEIISTTTDESGDNNNVLANINMGNMYDLDISANHSIDITTQVVNMNLTRTFEVSSAEVIISGEKSNGLVDSGIFLKGNVFSQDIIRMDSGSYVHIAKGTNGSTGYVKFAQLKITSSYQNGAIIMHIIQRNTVENIITIMFNNENTSDPTLKVFSNYGEQKYYIVKSSTSTWDLYGQKTEAYDSIYVSQYYKHSYLTGITLTWTDTHASSLPSGYTTSTIYDTGWITISSFSNSLSQSSQSFSPTCAYRKIGNHVYIRGHVQTPSSWTGTTASTVFTIPSGYRPSTRKYVMNAMTGARLARVFIDTNGNLTLEWTRNMSDGSAISGALTWVDIAVDYFIN